MTISFWLYEEVKSIIKHIMEMELLCLLWGVWYGFIFNGTYFVDNDSDSNLTSQLKKSGTYWLNLKEICLHLSTALKLFSPLSFPFECSTSFALYDKVCLLLLFYCFICPCYFLLSSIFIDDTSLVQLELMDNKS